MATNRDRLNEGLPAPSDPPAVTTQGLEYGNALLGAFGKEAAPTGFGDYLRRIGAVQTGVSVTSNVATVGPGAVLAVQATAGSATGPKAMIMVGPAAAEQVLVEPQSDGTQQLTFAAADGVTACAVYLLQVSADLLTFLEATASSE